MTGGRERHPRCRISGGFFGQGAGVQGTEGPPYPGPERGLEGWVGWGHPARVVRFILAVALDERRVWRWIAPGLALDERRVLCFYIIFIPFEKGGRPQIFSIVRRTHNDLMTEKI